MVKLQSSKGRHSVFIPKEIVALKQWSKGDSIVVLPNLEKDEMVLVRQKTNFKKRWW